MLNDFSFQQIEAFLTIAKYQSITKACEILFMSQPALSKILKRFEDNFDTPLFTRTNYGMALTTAGKMLYAKLDPLYSDLDFVFRSIPDMIGPEERFLHIGLPVMFDFSAEFDPIKKALAEFKTAYPQIKLSESIYEFHRLQNALDVGRVDVIVAPEWSISMDKAIALKPICELRQYITMSASHPLAKSDELDFSLLGDYDFLAIPYQNVGNSKERLALLCRQNGITPKSIDCPHNFYTTLHSALIGNSITVSWPLDVDMAQQSLKYYPLPNVQPSLQAVVAWSPDRLTRALQLFLSMFKEI